MKTVISKEIALTDIETLINKFVKKPVSIDQIEETYPDILDAIMDGYVSFDNDGVPILKLKEPIKNEAGGIALEVINFKTRIKPSTLAGISKGINLSTDQFTLTLRMIAYIIDQPIAMIDRFGRYDYDVINQICTVFS